MVKSVVAIFLCEVAPGVPQQIHRRAPGSIPGERTLFFIFLCLDYHNIWVEDEEAQSTFFYLDKLIRNWWLVWLERGWCTLLFACMGEGERGEGLALRVR